MITENVSFCTQKDIILIWATIYNEVTKTRKKVLQIDKINALEKEKYVQKSNK